ncbi:Bax inhibitor-1/YccA family protein [Bifidobacterium sp.]|jgi:FtsH-binding integral membrane protein|uniref:Bax inhibitor-1/YccA family protein n=1 Tax=Bifidobacterium sp. TaxID=41200 RepID=UPI0025BE397B|nr:Bax inhibitor-1/YccA family protein [Bifidobacterium sp.]MCI1636035.1 Bax inhibitor-1/YccA family protein [Bifidobacterium sp.]
MSFGRQPQGYQNQGDPQAQYGQNTANQYQQQYGQQPYAQQAAINAQTAYSYESVQQASRVSITRAYGEMALGLIVTAVVALVSQITGALQAYMAATGTIGWIILAIVQVGLAISLGARIMKIRPATARLMFYGYAALMGFTLSSIFWAYNASTIIITLGFCAAFYFALTMFALTTKVNMLKAGPILLVGLVVLIISQIVLMFIAPSATTLRVVAGIGVVLFALMTVYDAQRTKALFAQFATQGPEMIKRISILCALNLYLDFVNLFLYLLQLFGASDN